MKNLENIIDDINVELDYIKKSKRKQKTIIDHWEFVKKLQNFYFYKIWIADDLKLQEDEKIILKTPGIRIEAVIISIHETQDFTIRTTAMLTDDIYHLSRIFDPAFILDALTAALTKINANTNEITRTLLNPLTKNEDININDGSTFLEDLNTAQIKSIQLSESKEVSIIWGPPGTGKTYTLSQIIYRAFLRKERVLILSTSNVAIDQVILYLDKFLHHNEKSSVLRLGHTDNDICLQYSKDNVLEITECIIFSTLATAALKYNKLSEAKFDLVIVDEASMVSLPYVFLAGSMASRNIVFAGDFQQLPPISLSEKEETTLSESIFGYLDIPTKIDNNIKIPYLALLDTQYRMCQDISDIVSSLFYKNLLKCGLERYADEPKIDRLLFIDIDKTSGYHCSLDIIKNLFLSFSD